MVYFAAFYLAASSLVYALAGILYLMFNAGYPLSLGNVLLFTLGAHFGSLGGGYALADLAARMNVNLGGWIWPLMLTLAWWGGVLAVRLLPPQSTESLEAPG